MKKGKLIVIEASNDRLGKTYLTNKLIQALKTRGEDVMSIHFPQSDSDVGKVILDLLNPKTSIDIKTLDPMFVANLYLLDMAKMSSRITNALEQGKYVILDRYYQSTMIFETTVAAIQSSIVDRASYASVIYNLAKNIYSLLEPDHVICLHAKDIIKKFYNNVNAEPDNFEDLSFQKELITTFYTIWSHSNLFDSFAMYDRGSDENLVECDDILEDILSYI